MKKYAFLALLLWMTGCASDEPRTADKPGDTEKPKAEAKKNETKLKIDDLICPQVAILRDAENHFDYGGAIDDPSQLVAEAKMLKVDGDCEYVKNGIDISVTLHMASRRGPRLGGDHIDIPYFTAIVDPSEKVLSRQVVTARFGFSGNDRVSESLEDLHVFIPLPEKLQQSGPDYRVLMGFETRKN